MKSLASEEVAAFVRDVLFDARRARPVVAITTVPHIGAPWVEAEQLAAALEGQAEVVFLETGEATWALAEALPPRLDAYGGAVRIWWPGLHAASDPYEHPLFFAHSAEQARAMLERVVQRVAAGARPQSRFERSSAVAPPSGRAAPPAAPIAAPPAALHPAPGSVDAPVVQATVLALEGRIELDAAGTRGVLVAADLPLDVLAASLEVGMRIPVRAGRRVGDTTQLSAVGLLPSPWQRLADEWRVGDVVQGRVQSVKPYGAFVDLLPGVTGLLHVSEMDWDKVTDAQAYARPGQLVNVQIQAMNVQSRRIELSLKRAYGSDPRPPLALVPGGPGFCWKDAAMPVPEGGGEQRELLERIAELSDEIEAAAADRTNLAEQLKQHKQQLAESKRELRSEQDRVRNLERRVALENPLSSERAFLLAIRLCYARMFDEDDRGRWPLRRMRVGPAFLASLRALDGVEIGKVIEVCTQVACDVAATLPGREVHQLRDGLRGARTHVRAADSAKAWRCSLQDNTPSARRLHWWSMPGTDGATIEFANVGVHDDYTIA